MSELSPTPDRARSGGNPSRPGRRVEPLARNAPPHAARRCRLLLDPLRRHGPGARQDVARLGRRSSGRRPEDALRRRRGRPVARRRRCVRAGQPARGAADLDVGRPGRLAAGASRRPSSVPLRSGRRSEARRGSSCSSRRQTSRPSSSTSGRDSGAPATARRRRGLRGAAPSSSCSRRRSRGSSRPCSSRSIVDRLPLLR